MQTQVQLQPRTYKKLDPPVAMFQDENVYVLFVTLFGYELELGPEKIGICVGVADELLYMARLSGTKWKVMGPVDNPVIVTSFTGHYTTQMKVSELAKEAMEWYKLNPLPYLPGWGFRTLKNFLTVALGTAVVAIAIYATFYPELSEKNVDFIINLFKLVLALSVLGIFPSSNRPEDMAVIMGWLFGTALGLLLWTQYPPVIALFSSILK